VIVVLTDGSNNRGIDPQSAAKEAADRGVRIFTIGYGTDNPASLACSSSQFGGFGGVGFGFGGGSGGEGNPFEADYGALMQISRTTGGTFFRAQDADQLSRALAKLPAAFTIVRKHIDIASWFAAAGGLLIAAAVALSLWWNRARRAPGSAVSPATGSSAAKEVRLALPKIPTERGCAADRKQRPRRHRRRLRHRRSGCRAVGQAATDDHRLQARRDGHHLRRLGAELEHVTVLR